MKKNLISIAAAATFGLLALAPAAHAADGEINFTGSVISSSCVINGGADFTVALPPVSTTALASLGKTAGRVPVAIALTGCTPGSKIRAHFESGATTNGAGRLIADGAGAANVDLQLLNAEFDAVKAGAEAQNTTPVTVSAGGTADLKYYVEYYSTGAATAGAVKSRVNYTIAYE